MTISVPALLEPVLAVARKAGDSILEVYQSGFTVDRKDDDSPVTAADEAANQLIIRALSRLTPSLPVISEEQPVPTWRRRQTWSFYWLLDPLDGTREFIRRNGQFAVNIALIEDGRPVLGVVHAPTDGRSWFGGPGIGAFHETRNGSRSVIQTRRHASPPYRVVLGRSRPRPHVRDMLARLPEHEILHCGSSIKICLIAEGEADLFPRLGPISEWDLAAPQAILEAAGGGVLDLGQLAPLRYNQRSSLTLRDVVAVGDPDARWWQCLQSEPVA
ncbi:3'(2'),5'-bisphosphate nucleotidase CysQ [Methylonatrum kenyense]|uniref:3'(2'),5'-bisphosphate nucleotidase CysQ n=1 Tax=Methylonatrum kenyense TaxID=455253 RepID=UPI0020BF342F|nr:3'(2'),5'-bisphosphate nucleotidase CysQ [Methylonatrum kenyense]MCK8517021.1 3'(2'),5'-bisphosphate nucleotidase CysQ [Methylonatrum kenyense]